MLCLSELATLVRHRLPVRVLLFNNRIYGLTKGQYSPTSEHGKVTKSTPLGSVDHPFNPISVAIGAEGTFVARTIDVEAKHLQDVVRQAYEHKGTSFVEILQNCNIFNDGAFADLTEKDRKGDTQLVLAHGKPLVFGKNNDKGIRMRGHSLEVVQLDSRARESDLIVHDEKDPNPAYAFLLSRMDATPGFPTPLGVLRAEESVKPPAAKSLRKSASVRSRPVTLTSMLRSIRVPPWSRGSPSVTRSGSTRSKTIR